MKKLNFIERRIHDYKVGDVVQFFVKNERGCNVLDGNRDWAESLGVVRQVFKRWLILEPEKPVNKFDVFAIEEKM